MEMNEERVNEPKSIEIIQSEEQRRWGGIIKQTISGPNYI